MATSPEFMTGDKVRIVKTRAFGHEVDQVDSKGELLRGQTGVVESVMNFKGKAGNYRTNYRYMVRTKNPSYHSNGLFDFWDGELEAVQ